MFLTVQISKLLGKFLSAGSIAIVSVSALFCQKVVPILPLYILYIDSLQEGVRVSQVDLAGRFGPQAIVAESK